MRTSRLAGLGLAFALTAGTVGIAAAPANAALPPEDRAGDASLAALVEWLETHELQDWLNFLALTNPPAPTGASHNPPPKPTNSGTRETGATHAPPPKPTNQGASQTGATHAPPSKPSNQGSAPNGASHNPPPRLLNRGW
ncbi:hypothetical protein CC117_21295 [Parafrankia colletiae]|uniref:Secreted protein n=1 Tax=Parafrankia colletiae TaxID=573497 RepID=A0A1S1QMS2_9ACTN|nr:hypothetical protein [Parafrankia colletiae]MCK9900942.1 hypothetical protein [Frankia sp. Cpl3]OHV34555.1 hypothetical protein CC117_21295 [Parafrankia colletiae]